MTNTLTEPPITQKLAPVKYTHVVASKVMLLPTAYVVRREGYVLTRVCSHLRGGGCTPARSRRGGGYPTLGTPPPFRPGRGRYPTSGTPPLPPVGPGRGVPHLGTPPPPSRTWPEGGVPLPGATVRIVSLLPCSSIFTCKYTN